MQGKSWVELAWHLPGRAQLYLYLHRMHQYEAGTDQ